MMKHKLLLFLFCLNVFTATAGDAEHNYRQADSIAQNTRYKGDITKLVNELTASLDNNFDKTRAIYYWITENISYDYKKFNKGKRIVKFKCRTKSDCQAQKDEFEKKLAESVLRRKKDICSGYAILFKRMCELAKINCLSIDGYVKFKAYHVGNMGILDHAWNAVIIDNETYYCDLTWAAGYCEKGKNGKLKNFVRHRNDFYWFTPVDKFTVDHFPKKPEGFPDFELTKDDYKNQPFIETGAIPLIEIESPQRGIIKARVNDTVVFKFRYLNIIDKIQINTNIKRNPKVYHANKKGVMVFNQRAFNKQEYIPFKKDNNEYEFKYVVKDDGLKYLEILFDYKLKLKYLVTVVKADKKS